MNYFDILLAKKLVNGGSPTPPGPPADGKTRLYVSLAEGRLSPVLGLGVNGSVDVDWGDGTAHGTLAGSSTSTLVTIPHTYAQGGDYVITLTAAESTTIAVLGANTGSLLFTKDGAVGNEARVYRTSLKKAYLGNSVTNIETNAFNSCYGLSFIKFESTAPPTIGSSTTFNGVPTDCIIYVPEGTLEAYTSATNYPDPDAYSYIEY